MTRHAVRAAACGFFLLGIGCAQQPVQPSAAAPAALSVDTGAQPSLHLGIDPSPLRIGAPVMRDGARMYPVTWTMTVTEMAGAPFMIDGWTCELHSQDGTIVHTAHFDGWHDQMHGHAMWKLMDQTAYLPDPAAFGHGALMLKLHARSMGGRVMEITATAPVW